MDPTTRPPTDLPRDFRPVGHSVHTATTHAGNSQTKPVRYQAAVESQSAAGLTFAELFAFVERCREIDVPDNALIMVPRTKGIDRQKTTARELRIDWPKRMIAEDESHG